MGIKDLVFYAESWNVAYRFTPIANILINKKEKFNIIPNSQKYWAADPMTFEYNGVIYIFAELYDYRLCRGTIGYTKFDGKSFSKWKQVLTEDFHLSFPNVFLMDNTVYMIPESSVAEQLLLYKAVDFPDKWERVKTIKDDVRWVDTVFVKTTNGYIGFTEELSNPIKDYRLTFDNHFNFCDKEVIALDSKLMRNGGRVLEINDEYIKVCQDCEEKYGGALIFRVYDKTLSKELKTIRISPNQLIYNKKVFLDGMHTYSALNNMEVIDIKTRRFNLLNFIFRIIKKFSR